MIGPFDLLRRSAQQAIGVAPARRPQSATTRATSSRVVRAIRRAKRLAEATTPAQYREAELEFCDKHGELLRDEHGTEFPCTWGCRL